MTLTRDDIGVLDPQRTAPPLVVDNRPEMDTPGHSYTLPLVGRARPYLLDVVFTGEEGRESRVYADTREGVLSAMIPGYLPETPSDAGKEELADAFEQRHVYTDIQRRALQARINTVARADGSWQHLDEEERAELSAAAEGEEFPLGIVHLVTVGDDDGEAVQVEKGYWSAQVALVVNRGDYGEFDPLGTPEPESEIVEPGPDGRRYARSGSNVIVLDPSTPDTLVATLAAAELIAVTERHPDLPDGLALEALRAGAEAPAAG